MKHFLTILILALAGTANASYASGQLGLITVFDIQVLSEKSTKPSLSNVDPSICEGACD